MLLEDLDGLFDDADLAVAALYAGKVIYVLFDAPHLRAQGYEEDVSASAPQALCLASDVSGIASGSEISIRRPGEAVYTKYVVTDVQTDGTGPAGCINLVLQEA